MMGVGTIILAAGHWYVKIPGLSNLGIHKFTRLSSCGQSSGKHSFRAWCVGALFAGGIPGCKAHWGWLDQHLMQRMVQALWPAAPGAPCDARWRNRRRPPSTSLPPPLSTNDSTASIDDAASGNDATDPNQICAKGCTVWCSTHFNHFHPCGNAFHVFHHFTHYSTFHPFPSCSFNLPLQSLYFLHVSFIFPLCSFIFL